MWKYNLYTVDLIRLFCVHFRPSCNDVSLFSLTPLPGGQCEYLGTDAARQRRAIRRKMFHKTKIFRLATADKGARLKWTTASNHIIFLYAGMLSANYSPWKYFSFRVFSFFSLALAASSRLQPKRNMTADLISLLYLHVMTNPTLHQWTKWIRCWKTMVFEVSNEFLSPS